MQKERLLLEADRLQDCSTDETILALGCPSLWCHISKVQEEDDTVLGDYNTRGFFRQVTVTVNVQHEI